MASTCSNPAFEWKDFKSGQPLPENTIGVGHEADGKQVRGDSPAPALIIQFHACRVKLDNGSYIPAKFGESTGRGGLCASPASAS